MEDKIVAQGSGIARYRKGQGADIATFIDQSVLDAPLVWCVNGEVREIAPNESVEIAESIESACWLHQGQKGYVILPRKKLELLIKTGTEINVTDRRKQVKKSGFIIAVNHGANPGTEWDNGYCYFMLPNVSKEEMPRRMEQLLEDVDSRQVDGVAHAVCSASDKTWQYAFFQPGTVSAGEVEVASEDVAQIILREEEDDWVLSVGNPMPDGKKQTLNFRLSVQLPQGTYTYQAGGIYL